MGCAFNVQGGPKFGTFYTPYNIDQFSNFFHCKNQDKFLNNSVTKDPNTPQVCRYTTL